MTTTLQDTSALTAIIQQSIKVGDRLTVIDISESMANTNKSEITMDQVGPVEFRPHYQTATHGLYRIGLFHPGRKRNRYHLALGESTLLFPGWDIPVKTDYEVSRSFHGNACLNLSAASVDELKQWIETMNLNPLFDYRHAVIFVQPPDTEYGQNRETLVYPELPTRGHAVIERMRSVHC